MDRRHKALVLATTLFVVLSILGFFFVAGTLAHDNLKIRVRTVDDTTGVSVSYSFGGQHDVPARVHAKNDEDDDVLLGSGHSSNELAIDELPSKQVETGGEADDASGDTSDDASGDGEYEDGNYGDGDKDQDGGDEGYDPIEQANQYHQQYEQYDHLVGEEDDASGSLDVSVGDDDASQQQPKQQIQQQDQQQTQQQQDQQQTQQGQQQQGQQQSQQSQQQHQQQTQQSQQAQQQQGQQRVKRIQQRKSKTLTATPLPPIDDIFGCGDDRNVVKTCAKPSSPTELELFRMARTIAELSYLNYECSGVLLGDSTENAYLLTTADCVYHDTLARSGRVGIEECESAKLHTYSQHTLHHVNRTLGYVIIKMNASGRDTDAIAAYAKLSRRGAIVGDTIVVAGYSNTYGQSVATTYDHKPITIQSYKPTGVQSIMKQGFCPNMTDTTGLVTYMAHSMDGRSRGSPVFSVADGSVVALHLCGACIFNSSNTALSSKKILDDLEASGKLRSEFVAP